MEQQVVSAYEYLRQQGQTYVVFHPTDHLLYLGFGCEDSPRVVPHCIAENTAAVGHVHATNVANSNCSWRPEENSYEALVEVQKALHLPAPPRPPNLNQQQQRQQNRASLEPPGSQQPGHADAAVDQPGTDLFPAAKAGLVSSRQVAEGTDGFSWANVRRGGRASHAGQQQQQQQRQPPGYLPCLAGTQVAALWPGEPYEAQWLMTADGHIAGLGTTPERLILERFEAVWRWALSVELGLTAPAIRQLSAVLLVHHDSTAAEVRLLADLLLERLGFASLVVHLQPVAATFGNSATSACVVDISSSGTSICCIDDAVVLNPASSRVHINLGLTRIASALVGWMGCYGHWPVQLQQAEGGPGLACVITAAVAAGAAGGMDGSSSSSTGCPNVYACLLLEELVMQQCYFPKETLTLGLVGQAMLEEQPPALVPLRTPGTQTTNFQVSLGSWAAVAPMVCFYPHLAPTPTQLHWHDKRNTTSSSSPTKDAASDAAGNAASTAAGRSTAADGDSGLQYKHYHACVHDMPAAESMYLQGQLKARVEAGDAAAPPVGMYLPPLDMPAQAGAADADGEQQPDLGPATRQGNVGSMLDQHLQQRDSGSAAAAAAMLSAAAGDMAAAEAAADSNISLDEAVYRSIMAVAAHRPDLLDRLANGLLLTGPAAGLRGLGQMLERRLMQRFSYGGRQQVVNVLEHRAHPSHIVWRGGALLAALDSTRDNWLPRHQWVAGGMVLPPAAAQAAAGPGGIPGPGAGTTLATAAAGRHAKLFYYCKAESGY